MTPSVSANFECLQEDQDFCDDPDLPPPPADPFNEDTVAVGSASWDPASESVTVSGSVTTASGNAVAAVNIFAPGFVWQDSCVGSFVGQATQDANGNFDFTSADGSVTSDPGTVCARSKNNGSDERPVS